MDDMYIKSNHCSTSTHKNIIAGFQGTKGSFSEEALHKYFGRDIGTIAVKTFKDILIELKNKSITYGILPLENSSTGGIYETYDLLKDNDCAIVGEVSIKVEHHLLGIKGTKIKEIKEVYSHPQAFKQCEDFLNTYESWKLIPYYNTAKSAELVSNTNSKYIAAIGSRRAAELYHLDYIKRNINTSDSNYTRFAVIGRELELPSQANKVSIVFSTINKVGALFNTLKYFSENNINLIKIESRPIMDKPWEYMFYADLEGNIQNISMEKAIKSIQINSTYFKLLGNYSKLKNN